MIKPGNFKHPSVEDYDDYTFSMAAEIEKQLNDLLALDGLPLLPMDEDDREVRDRRRLFVAIARGVVKHLNDNRTSIDIEVPDIAGDTRTEHPEFDIEGL